MWLCKRPRILSFPNFLSTQECARLIQLAKLKGLERDSPVTDADPSIRTSSSCWLAFRSHEEDYACQTPQDERMMQSIATRISVASCLPEEHGETFQVLHYAAGQHYKAHPDYFHKRQQRDEWAMGGQRLATMLVYLSTVPEGRGGETRFPLARCPEHNNKKASRGLSIRPREGLGVLFFNTTASDGGRIEPASIHESLPVTGAEKWTLTRWIRQHPYPRPILKPKSSKRAF